MNRKSKSRSHRHSSTGRPCVVFEAIEPRLLLSALPVVSIDAIDPAGSENGDAGQFVVSRDLAADTPLKVKLAISGTAKNGKDYARIARTVTIPAYAAVANVTISPIDDGRAEPAETVTLTVAPASAYEVDTAQQAGTVTIADATYLAGDFFPLIDSARWDYKLVSGPQAMVEYITMRQDGDTYAWAPYSWENGQWDQQDVMNLQSTADGIVAVSHTDSDTTPYTPPELWLPATLVIGQTSSTTSDYSSSTPGVTKTVTQTVKVVGRKTITVPAGKYLCMKVQITTNEVEMPDGQDQPDYTSHTVSTVYLSRGVGIVRMDSKGTQTGDGQTQSGSEKLYMTSYSMPGAWTARADMARARDQFAGGVVGTAITVFGGNGNPGGVNLPYTEAFDTVSGLWSDQATSDVNESQGAEELTAAVVGGKVYYFGAWGGIGPGGLYGNFNLVQEFDPLLNTWTAKAPKPTPVSGAPCAAYHDGEIFVFGGEFTYLDAQDQSHQTWYKVVEAYNPATDTWRVVGNMPKMLAGAAVSVVGDKAYVIGGFVNARTPSSTVLTYDFTTGKWTSKGLAKLPVARGFAYSSAAPTLDGRIYLAGGFTGDKNLGWATSRVDIYDTVSNTWSAGPSLPHPLQDNLSVIVDRTLYVIGGDSFADEPDRALDEVWSVEL